MHILPASDLKCRPSASARANRRPQPHCPPVLSSPLQTNFFSPEWRPSCRLRSCCLAKALLQTVQTKGRSSVCVLRCERRLYARVNRLGQREHWNVAGCFCDLPFAPGWPPSPGVPAYSGSASLRAMTLFGTDDVDAWRLRFGEGERLFAPEPPRSRGERERDVELAVSVAEAGEREADPEGVRRWPRLIPPVLKGSVTALCRCFGRPVISVSSACLCHDDR